MNSNSEKISVLISNTNEKYLEEAIGSLLNQTSDNWELFILGYENNSNLKELSNKYSENLKIHITFREEKFEYAEALKELISMASTDIVGILNANDKLHETAIEKVLNRYKQYYKAGFVYTNFWFCDKNMSIKKNGFCKPVPNGFTNLNHLYTSSFITFRKSVFNKIDNYDESIPFAEDIDLVLKMEEITRLHCVDEPLYYLRDDKTVSQKIKMKYQRFKSIQKAKENAYIRRGLPNRNSLIERIKDPDFDYFRKRKARKNPSVINKNDGLENLLSAKKIFNKLGINYWLTDGTLLGYYREKDFIKHDFDLDLGSFIKDYDERIINEFLNEGWILYREYGRKDVGFEQTFVRDYLKLDVFYFYEDDDKRLWHGAWSKTEEGLNLIKYYYEPFELTKGGFLSHEFTIPKDTLKYITTKYGKSWNKPVKDWDWADGPSNSKRTSIYL